MIQRTDPDYCKNYICDLNGIGIGKSGLASGQTQEDKLFNNL